MKVKAIKTHKITEKDKNILDILDLYLPRIKENSIVAVTSKVIAITQGRLVKIGPADKDLLVKKESDYFLPKEENRYQFFLTIKNNILIATAGIDESNGNGFYILWPKNLQKTCNQIRTYLKDKYSIKKVGVIITDSKTTPLRKGTTGFALAYSGFMALNNYIEKPDIFGRYLKVTKANIADGLAATAVTLMGEGKEQTPLSVIEDLAFVQFQDRNPSAEELGELNINIEDDLYAPLLKAVKWRKGGVNG